MHSHSLFTHYLNFLDLPSSNTTQFLGNFWLLRKNWSKVSGINTQGQHYPEQTFKYWSITGTVWVWFGLSSWQIACVASVIWWKTGRMAYPGSFPPQCSLLGCNRLGLFWCPNQPFGGGGASCSKWTQPLVPEQWSTDQDCHDKPDQPRWVQNTKWLDIKTGNPEAHLY